MTYAMMGDWQMPFSWHEGGLFIGMHWIWWLIWIATVSMLLWAFVRLYVDRANMNRRVGREEAAEEVLRRRFADGEIDEEEFARRMKLLREAMLGG